MFELAQAVGLWGSQNSMNHLVYGRTRLRKIDAKIRLGHFFMFLALASVIYGPVHLFNTSCGLKVLIKKDVIKKIV